MTSIERIRSCSQCAAHEYELVVKPISLYRVALNHIISICVWLQITITTLIPPKPLIEFHLWGVKSRRGRVIRMFNNNIYLLVIKYISDYKSEKIQYICREMIFKKEFVEQWLWKKKRFWVNLYCYVHLWI